MITALHIPKRYGTYADPFFMLGLARVADLTQENQGINLMNSGFSYRLQLGKGIEPETIAQTLKFDNLFQPVRGAKTEAIAIPWEALDYFDTVQNTEKRNRYKEYLRQLRVEKGKLELAEEDIPPEPDARTQNGVILTSMRHDRNHNGLWEAAQTLREEFGALVAAILQAFDAERPQDDPISSIAPNFKQLTGNNLPAPASAVKIFMPTAVQGVNRLKADNNKSSDSQKEEWISLWLIATGLFHYGISERIGDDWRVVALEPSDISLFRYGSVLDQLRKFNPPSGAYGIARFDAEMVLNFSLELLKYHPAKAVQPTINNGQMRSRLRGQSIREQVGGFSGTHFGSKGQVYGVKEVFSLGIPNWICPSNADEVKEYEFVLNEHLKVVKSLSAEEGNGEMLAAYRDFIAGSERDQFFRFQVSYADYVVKQLANPKAKFVPPRFSQEGLDIMTQSFDKSDQSWSTTEITQNKGFQRIARAINSATVYAGKIKTKEGTVELDWQRTYGLAQRLSNQAGSKKDFIAELTAFLTSYENENLRISEQLQKDGKILKRVWVTNEDLEQFLALLDDKRFSCSLVANLLLAYGYAKWKKPLDTEPADVPTIADDADDNE